MNVFFGGPDKPPYFLRDLLAQKIGCVKPGGEIFWVTYYFRDLVLAHKLIEAVKRGVKVSLVLEARPRLKNANDEVYNLLKSSDVNVKYVKHPTPHKRLFKGMPKIHEKIYYFRDKNEAFAFIGSFNPSGRENDDPEIIELIGDQDRGHNFLVEITDTNLLNAIYEHCKYMKNINHGILENFKRQRPEITTHNTTLYFFPHAGVKRIKDFFNCAESGDKIFIAASHITLFNVFYNSLNLKKENIKIEIISHNTRRRFPKFVQKELEKNSIKSLRYEHPNNYPMHNKFIIIEKQDETLVGFGSLNLTHRSLYESHEIFAVTNDKNLAAAFKKRWQEIYLEIVNNSYE